MIVSDILQDLKSSEVLGVCSDDVCFSRLSDAVSLISNQGILDPNIGQMDICTCNGCITLPNDIGTVLAVNKCGYPTLMRDQWFQYNAAGTGTVDMPSCSYTDIVGTVSTFRDPNGPVALVAEVESARDSNTSLRVFGWDVDGKRIFTPNNSNGTLEDGFLVPCVFGFSEPNPIAPLIARIDRVQKVVTNGFIRLIAVNSDGSAQTLIGHYQPPETSPNYVRINVGCNTWARVKYRKRDMRVVYSTDWINIDNREVLILAVKAVNFRRKNNIQLASQMEAEAVRLLNNEAEAKRPPAISAPIIIMDVWPPASGVDCSDRLFY